jgi:hypothetical protein
MDGIHKFAFVEVRDQDDNRHYMPLEDIVEVVDVGAGFGRCKLIRKSIGEQQSSFSFDTVVANIDQRWSELRAAMTDAKYRITSYAEGTAYQLTATPTALTFGTTSPAVVLAQAGTYLIRGRVNLLYNGATFAANRTVQVRYRRTNNIAGYLDNGATSVTTAIVTTHTGLFATINLPEVVYETFVDDDNIAIYGEVSVVPSAGSLDAVEAELIAQRIE